MNCKVCGKLDFEFYSQNKSICKDCYKQRSMKWNSEHIERKREIQNKVDWVKRGIVDLDKARFIKNSIKSCALCSATDNLQVDHCHETGNVRSMLCGRCNRSLGGFGDNPELLRKAANYVEEHKAARIQNEANHNQHAFAKAA